jgi:ATP-dependent RNA helicase MSS116
VATPGRLKDHLASTNLRNKPFVDALANLQTLVLDETDRLLDMGFRKDIQDILSSLPRGDRQTLLFSATLPRNVRAVVELANKPDYVLVDCIQDEDPATHTNAQIEQSHIILSSHRFWTGSMEVLLDLMKGKSKIMVFFPMTSLVQLYATMFNLRFGRRVLELHGKMHQRERTTISGRFRNASNGILFTSDVSARGVDYPNVTHVIQIGASDSRETYIHRLGRTGRAGKRGQGLLILPELEQDFLQDLEGLDIPRDDDLQNRLSVGASKQFLDELGPVAQAVRAGRDPKLKNSVHDAYQAMVAYYFHRYKDFADEFVSTVNSLVEGVGLTELPAIDINRARRIGIDDLPGLNIEQKWKENSWTDGRGEQSQAKSGRKPFGKPFGDFGGKFETQERSGSSFDRRKSWDGPDSTSSDRVGLKGWPRPGDPPRNHNGRRNSSDESDSFHNGRSRSSPRSERPSGNHPGGKRTGKSRNSEQPAKLGFKKDPFGNFGRDASQKKKGSFQRWTSPGSGRKKT